MKGKTRKFSFILTVIILCCLLSGCYDRREPDDLAYVMSLGIDKGKTNNLRLTVQIAAPLQSTGTSVGSVGGGDESGEGGKSVIMTVESPTFFAAFNMLNNSLSKQLFMSHAKLMVFSEEMAREGLGKYLHTLIRSREFRQSMYFAVSRGPAEDYIKSIKPFLDPSPAKYYELAFTSGKYTGFIPGTQLGDFYMRSESLNQQPVANLAGVGRYDKPDEFDNKYSTYLEKGETKPLEGAFKAGDIPKTGGVKGEIMGLAVFDGDKLVGELDGEENTLYLMLTGEYGYAYWTIPDPRVQGDYVVLNIRQSRKPKIKVEMAGGKPLIHEKIMLEADFSSIQSEQNYETEHGIFEKAASDFIRNGMINMLNKTAGEFKSDIVGFGKYIQPKFLTWNEWQKFNWLEKYRDSQFDISVDLKVRRPGLIIRSYPEVVTEERKEQQ